MCIIVAKPENVELPSIGTLRNCFRSNSDGAGFSFLRNGKIEIRKGYFSFEKMLKALRKEKISREDAVLYHFRLATHGEVTPANTQPLPITGKEKRLTQNYVKGGFSAFAHNGILDVDDNWTLSDSQVFVRDILSGLYPHLHKKELQRLYKLAIAGNKTAILSENGLQIDGSGWIEDEGIYFSNSSYTSFKKKGKKDGKSDFANLFRDVDFPELQTKEISPEEGESIGEDTGGVGIEEGEEFCPLCWNIVSLNDYYCPQCGTCLFVIED